MLTIPDSAEWRAALSGALLLLTYPENWESFGSVSPCEAANAFLDTLIEAEDRPMVGEVFWWAGQTLPSFALACDGAEHRAADYPKLAAILGDTYGEAAAGYFRVPNLATRAAFGVGSYPGNPTLALGDSGGLASVSLSTDQLPAHRHTIPGTLTGLAAAPGEQPVLVPTLWDTLTGSTGDGEAHTNMPPYLALMPAIVAK